MDPVAAAAALAGALVARIVRQQQFTAWLTAMWGRAPPRCGALLCGRAARRVARCSRHYCACMCARACASGRACVAHGCAGTARAWGAGEGDRDCARDARWLRAGGRGARVRRGRRRTRCRRRAAARTSGERERCATAAAVLLPCLSPRMFVRVRRALPWDLLAYHVGVHSECADEPRGRASCACARGDGGGADGSACLALPD